MRKMKSRTKTKDIPQINIMSSPSSPTKSTSTRRGSRDTGFPEPFDGDRNTTLPHPDADLSPNACISQEDFTMEHIKRTRRSFLSKHRRTTSHGYITPTMEAVQSTFALAGIDTSGASSDVHNGSRPRLVSSSASMIHDPKDDLDSIGESSRDRLSPPSSPDLSARGSSIRRMSFLNRWVKK